MTDVYRCRCGFETVARRVLERHWDACDADADDPTTVHVGATHTSHSGGRVYHVDRDCPALEHATDPHAKDIMAIGHVMRPCRTCLDGIPDGSGGNSDHSPYHAALAAGGDES